MRLYEQIDMLPVWFYSSDEITAMLRQGFIYRSVWFRKITEREIEAIEHKLENERRDKEYDKALENLL